MEGELEISIVIENEEQLKQVLDSFSLEMEGEVYNSLLRTANKEEKILKSTARFTDRTGKGRRSLFVTATFNPLGIEGGSYNPYMKYVAKGHGTWRGNWWETYKKGAIPRIFKDIERAVNKVVKKFNRGE